MDQLAPDYLSELSRQIGFISAFLGGVAATLMAALLSLRPSPPLAGWAIAAAAAAAVAFIVTVVATTLLIAALHPHAPQSVANGFGIDMGRLLAFLPFAAGMYLLLACIGIAGWLRSSRMGRLTSGIAALGAVLITFAVVG